MNIILTRVMVAAALTLCACGAPAESPGAAKCGPTTAPAAAMEKAPVERHVYTFQSDKLVTHPAGTLTITAAKPGDASTPIRNPFYAHPAWRLGFNDNSPIDIRYNGKQTTLVVPPEAVWNDCYMSLDGGHSGPLAHKPTGNYFDAPDYYDQQIMAPPELLSIFGVNFTSESLTLRGRYIVDDFENNDRTERHFFFANCVRGSNAYISYNDTDPERAYDEYDALFGHSLQTIGHSGGPPYALKKMLDAGEVMPRKTS